MFSAASRFFFRSTLTLKDYAAITLLGNGRASNIGGRFLVRQPEHQFALRSAIRSIRKALAFCVFGDASFNTAHDDAQVEAIYFGAPEREWLSDRRWALPALMLMSIWTHSGYFMLILLAALQALPKDLYEAARLDSVSWFRQLRITVPLVSPMLYFVLIIGTLHSCQIFDYVYVMTHGGPDRPDRRHAGSARALPGTTRP